MHFKFFGTKYEDAKLNDKLFFITKNCFHRRFKHWKIEQYKSRDDESLSSFYDNNIPSIGPSLFTKDIQIGNHTVNIKVVDTAGQEKYKSLSAGEYRDSDGFILVYDVTNLDSLKHIDNWIAWINDALSCSRPMILFGNKMDLNHQDNMESAGKRIADKHQIPFALTSAKTGDNINLAIHDFAKSLLPKVETTPEIQELELVEKPISRRKSPCCRSS